MNDDEVEARLRAALRQFADDAPPGVAMLGSVAAESGRRSRRVRLAALASGTAALAVIGAAVPFALYTAPAPAPGAVAVASAPAARPSAARPSVAPARPWSAPPATLGPATVPTTLLFPVQPPAGDGYGAPIISISAGRPSLWQTLPSSAQVTVTAYDTEPPPPAGDAHASATEVAGRSATLYEWAGPYLEWGLPGAGSRTSLVWHPAERTWLRLDADPSTGVPLLIAYAEALKPRAAKVEAPFVFKVMPAGWSVDNLSPAVATFAPPGTAPSPAYEGKLVVTLDEDAGLTPKLRDAPTAGVRVGDRQGWLTTTAQNQFLQVPVDGGHSLMLQVDRGSALPRDVLLAFAAGIAVTSAAQVSHG